MVQGLMKALPRPYPNYVVHGQNWSTGPTGPTDPTDPTGPTDPTVPTGSTHAPTDMQVLLASGDIWKPQSHSKNKNKV